MKTCSVENCQRDHYAIGLCRMHYTRSRKGHSLTEKSVYQMSPKEKFEQKYVISHNGCWEWKFPRPDGRANTFFYDGVVQSAYRASYQIHNGKIPDGLCVLHRCDNGLCVNPNHLFLGTHKDNTQDMIEKGRQNTARGIQRGKGAKLSEDAVRDIKSSSLNGNQLAKKHGVHRRTIYDILDGKTWTHIM